MARKESVALGAMNTKDGDRVMKFVCDLGRRGAKGAIGCALFRAFNNSARAKKIRRGRSDRYGKKNEALEGLCTALTFWPLYSWGWGHDANATGYENVLYVDLPNGQVSFHSPKRLDMGEDYKFGWDGERKSEERIADFCDEVLASESLSGFECVPFGKHAGVPIKSVSDSYFQWLENVSDVDADLVRELLDARAAYV